MLRRPLILLSITLTLLSSASAFQYYLDTPEQCGQLNLSWAGGKGPYNLLIIPTGESTQGQILNVTIPETATSPYYVTLAEPAGLKFVAAMWDSESGLAGTSVTEELTVGSSSNSSCLRQAGTIFPDFYFSTSPATNPAQCESVRVTWDSNYTAPAHLVGVIPGGNIFEIDTVTEGGSTGTDWTVNVKEGTQLLLAMSDTPKGGWGTGGSTNLWTVQGSGDSSCLSKSSPASITASSTNPTGTGSTATQSVAGVGGGGGLAESSGSTGGSSNAGAIAGGVVGGLTAMALLILGFWFYRRRLRQVQDPHNPRSTVLGGARNGDKSAKEGGDLEKAGRRSTFTSGVDLLGIGSTNGRRGSDNTDSPEEDEAPSPGAYEPSPFFGGNGQYVAANRASSDADQSRSEFGTELGGKTLSDATNSRTTRHGELMGSGNRPPNTASSRLGVSENNGDGENSTSQNSNSNWSDFASTWLAAEATGDPANGAYNSNAGSRGQPQSHTGSPEHGGNGNGFVPPTAGRFASTNSDSNSNTFSGGRASPTLLAPAADVTSSPARSNSTRKAPLRVANPTHTSNLNPNPNANQNATPLPGSDGQRTTRFVLHEDAGEMLSAAGPEDEEDAVVEMPPRYDQLRSTTHTDGSQ